MGPGWIPVTIGSPSTEGCSPSEPQSMDPKLSEPTCWGVTAPLHLPPAGTLLGKPQTPRLQNPESAVPTRPDPVSVSPHSHAGTVLLWAWGPDEEVWPPQSCVEWSTPFLLPPLPSRVLPAPLLCTHSPEHPGTLPWRPTQSILHLQDSCREPWGGIT